VLGRTPRRERRARPFRLLRARFSHAPPLPLIIFPFPSSSLINVYKKAKAGAATLARKTKYTFKELTDKVETWSRRDRS
jgi:hypothetical protein